MGTKDRYFEESREGAKAVLDRMMKILGSPPTTYAEALDVSPNTIKTWLRRGEVSLKHIQGFATKHGVSVDFVMRGDEAVKGSSWVHSEPKQSSASTIPRKHRISDAAIPVYHMAGQPGDQHGEIDELILQNCLSACAALHGEAFEKLPVSQQIGYGCDLYNLLVRMCRSNEGNLNDIKRLEVVGLTDQLRAFIKLGWARGFPPKPDGCFF